MRRALTRIVKRLTRGMVVRYKARKAVKREAGEARGAKIQEEVAKDIQCPNIYSGIPIFMGSIGGMYNPKAKSITINHRLSKGTLLVDAMYHEDRHYQQDTQWGKDLNKDYIRPEEHIIAYRNQHIEKDARRYAYVNTCRFVAKGTTDCKKLGLYKFLFHPWNGVIAKYYSLKGKAFGTQTAKQKQQAELSRLSIEAWA